ncbi:exo-alpha-sialidase [Desulfonatronum thiosulfatophilum]|uniref:exo-alpha-sialidase n=1 Tax=Desulfonatronum thiosulfatophilum TaxID=617002 RepID=UPI0011143146|nr:exo-alpha-sialidase [Desulfonatronum thiosulfatophilum]
MLKGFRFFSRRALLLTFAMIFMAGPAWGATKVIQWDDPVEVAEGEAFRGPWQMNESDWRFVDDPSVALTEDRQAGVVWVDQARQDLFFQVYGPDGEPRFDEPVNVSRSPEVFSWLPRVIMSGGEPETVFILWQEIIFSGGSHGGDILFARSQDGGRTFSEPLNLSNTIAGAGKGRLSRDIWFNGSLDMALGPEGNIYVVWTEYEGALRFSHSTDQGQSFSESLLIAGGRSEPPARGPSLAVSPEGEIHLAWSVGEEGAADIRYTRSTDHGRSFFAEHRFIVPSTGFSDAPKIAADERGIVHIAYTEGPFGPLQGLQVHYSQSVNGGLFPEAIEISQDHAESFAGAGFPSLELDGQGNVYVLWELFPEKGFTHPSGLGITFSDDNGQTFADPIIVPGTDDPGLGFNGSQQGMFMNKLAVNRNGDLAIVNSTFKAGESSRIRLIRGRIAAEE